MPTQAVLTLQTLRCIRESDRGGSSHSDPYVWPFLASVTSNSFATTPTAAILSDSRTIVRNEMRAGDSAPIPYPVNTVATTFDDDQTNRQLLLVVALWEADDTPSGAVQAGYQAYLDELHVAVGSNLLALAAADDAERQALIDQIKQRVYQKVYAAIEGHLSTWEKTKVYLGWLNLDDFMGSDFKLFSSVVGQPFTLHVNGFAGDLIVSWGSHPSATNPPVEYAIDATLTVKPVTVNVCQREIDAVNAAQAALQGLQAQVQALQAELQHATPQEKSGIVAEIKQINEDEIPPAQAALDAARAALERCRSIHNPPRPPVSPPAIG